jgi:hypothetical protein
MLPSLFMLPPYAWLFQLPLHLLHTKPQFGPVFVVQNPFALKQQYPEGVVEQILTPPLPP